MTGSGSIQHHRFATTDPDIGLSYVRDVMYVDHRVQPNRMRTGYLCDLNVLQIGSTMLHRFRHSTGAWLDVAHGVPSLAVTSYTRSTAKIETADGLERPGTGTALAYPTGMPFVLGWEEVDTDTVQFDDALLAECAEPHLDRGDRLRFAFGTPVSAAAADTWRRTTSLVRKVASANAANRNGALLADELTRLLNSTALTCFPNTTMRSSTVPRSQVVPASLRRAVAYIDAHLDQPIRLADLAAAARVTPRALNETFNRHYDISPIGYLRRARLDRAHHDLKAAQPGDGQTVTGIAARWGFYSLPRFGVTYRRTYGRPPSHTLRHTPRHNSP